MRIIFACLICFLIPIAFTFAQDAAPATSTAVDAKLREVMDEVWDFELNENPMLATNSGDPRGQDRLADDSIDSINRRNVARKDFLKRLTEIEPASLTEFSRIDQELLRLRLEGQIADHRFQTHLMSINNREGFHVGFPELPHEMNPKTPADYKNYIARLRDFSRYADQQIALLRMGIEAGLTQPSIVMRDSVDQAMSHVVDDPNESLLMTNLSTDSQTTLGREVWEPIADQIRDAIKTSVIPGYQRFADFLKDEYVPACRGSLGASALPHGSEFYRDRILRFTTLELTPEELHQTGISENARIRGEMEAIVKAEKFDGDLEAFVQYLRTDPKFYAKTPEELLKEVAMILKTVDGRLPELFGRLPRIPYGIREIPAYIAPQTTAAYYWPPSTDGKRAGYYYVNTYNLSSRPLFELESLSMHEAVPGHHLQLALQAELTDLHPISRESNFTAFIEGWALYSERLGKEIGFYQDPYQDFGRLSMEAWRASRLVVDTGIHAMGWSRERAIEYMKANTALSEHNIVAEVDRYIGWPGQALAYKTGELAISRLRRSAEAQLGERFDVRAFHDRVLEAGSIPLPLLETRVNDWIADQK
ncbi:DUF885 domain-containing protein [Rubripirellula reticaptiva]|uniref:DUF885 domain-containing protein n=1 Tax=Rubripirellula reticaptiva TaxID=2528013 RepID=A0A5C6F9D4_9BACT|nr:DUF885 domain-containing protein [Rubripirellula reticaptiva]TWU58005.1 hypothetical protein Poly59_09140 [Rubripirellula reticaptiva]